MFVRSIGYVLVGWKHEGGSDKPALYTDTQTFTDTYKHDDALTRLVWHVIIIVRADFGRIGTTVWKLNGYFGRHNGQDNYGSGQSMREPEFFRQAALNDGLSSRRHETSECSSLFLSPRLICFFFRFGLKNNERLVQNSHQKFFFPFFF
jgi:hypothetical protein